MKPETVLVPINTARCHPEVFRALNSFGSRPSVTAVLLHVLHLNIDSPDNRIYGELAQEAHWHLERVAREFMPPDAAVVTRVRLGEPAEEILAEAAAENVNLIILPFRLPTFWQRLCPPAAPPIINRVVREAACSVFLTDAKRCINCRKKWGRPADDAVSALAWPVEPLVSESTPAFAAESG